MLLHIINIIINNKQNVCLFSSCKTCLSYYNLISTPQETISACTSTTFKQRVMCMGRNASSISFTSCTRTNLVLIHEGPTLYLCYSNCFLHLWSLSVPLHHIGVFPLRMMVGWVPGGGGVPSSFCAQSPKTDCGRKAFSQYCRQPAKRPTKAGGIKILTELGGGTAPKALIFDERPNISPPSLPELKSFVQSFR